MAKEKSPAFQFYPREFLADGNVQGMSLQQRGAYITLLCICWNDGSLPTNTSALANMCGTPLKAFLKFWPQVRACFTEHGDRYIHPRLELEREKQASYRRRQSDKGKASAAARNGQPNGNRGSTVVQPDTQPKANSPISDLRIPPNPPDGGLLMDDGLGERAAQFLERFSDVYHRVRLGAVSPIREARDFPRALEAVEKWPDLERLSLMVDVFLQMPNTEKNRPGTLGQFLHMAPECDHLLRANGR